MHCRAEITTNLEFGEWVIRPFSLDQWRTRFHSSAPFGRFALQIACRAMDAKMTALRWLLYEAANSLFCRVKSGPGQSLKDSAMAFKRRTSHKKAVVALARKLSVIMHAIWKDGTEFEAKEA